MKKRVWIVSWVIFIIIMTTVSQSGVKLGGLPTVALYFTSWGIAAVISAMIDGFSNGTEEDNKPLESSPLSKHEKKVVRNIVKCLKSNTENGDSGNATSLTLGKIASTIDEIEAAHNLSRRNYIVIEDDLMQTVTITENFLNEFMSDNKQGPSSEKEESNNAEQSIPEKVVEEQKQTSAPKESDRQVVEEPKQDDTFVPLDIRNKVFYELCEETIDLYEASNNLSCKQEILPDLKLTLKQVDPSLLPENMNRLKVRACSSLAHITFDLLSSGKYHLYRGVLNDFSAAPNLLKVYRACMDYALEIGEIDDFTRKDQETFLMENISSVG